MCAAIADHFDCFSHFENVSRINRLGNYVLEADALGYSWGSSIDSLRAMASTTGDTGEGLEIASALTRARIQIFQHIRGEFGRMHEQTKSSILESNPSSNEVLMYGDILSSSLNSMSRNNQIHSLISQSVYEHSLSSLKKYSRGMP